MTRAHRAYQTPVFADSDPLVCHSLALRPSLWAVVFNSMQQLGEAWSWRQGDTGSATVIEVITEIQNATDNEVFAGCIMIGQVIELEVETPPAWVLRCDGATYNRVDYPGLYAAIKSQFIIDADTFRVPDRVRRLAMDGITPGDQEGSETHTNTVAEMPTHRHTQDQWGVAESIVLGELPGFEAAPIPGYTGYEGSGDEWSILNPVEGAQFFIIARLPQAGD